jgi:hypothetical protein
MEDSLFIDQEFKDVDIIESDCYSYEINNSMELLCENDIYYLKWYDNEEGDMITEIQDDDFQNELYVNSDISFHKDIFKEFKELIKQYKEKLT